MRFVASLFVEPSNGFHLSPLVPDDVTRLSVVVSTNDIDPDSVIVYGVDLGNAAGEVDDSIVFERVVPLVDLGAFLGILADGQQGDDLGGGPIASSVDVGTKLPKPPQPSAHVVFAYAEAVGVSNTVSNANA